MCNTSGGKHYLLSAAEVTLDYYIRRAFCDIESTKEHIDRQIEFIS